MFRTPASTNSSAMRSGATLCSEATVEQLQRQVDAGLRLLEHFEWLINSFVLDFFHESHWSTLPGSWQTFLGDIGQEELAGWLDPRTCRVHSSQPVPLSLLALKQALRQLALDRAPVADLSQVARFLHASDNDNEGSDVNDNKDGNSDRWRFDPELMSGSSKHHQSLKHVFRKHVKPKKQYELCRLGKLASSVARSRGLDKVLDIGAGAGHLARYLGYNHGLAVACVDGDGDLTVSARKFDTELETAVEKMRRRCEEESNEDLILPPAPLHVTAHVSPDMDLDTFHTLLRNSFGMECGADRAEQELRYGLVGLHTCGDLAPVILRMFTQDPASKMIASLGCCYMKLRHHWPMSRHVAARPWRGLTYTSTELSCHALEVYADKLRVRGDEEKLKVHCYRAVLERMLMKRDPKYRHTILKTVAKSHLLSFPEYVRRATVNLVNEGMEPFADEELDNEIVNSQLRQWWKVVVFYTLRLAFAPVIGNI